MNALTRSLALYWKSSIGKKLIVAITGLILVLFLAGHLAGNLVVFLGQEAFNDYAQFLHHMLHGVGVWIARAVLLSSLVLHVWATIALTRQNKAAREQYKKPETIQAKRSSLIMIWTGLTILAFVVYHLLHFTICPKVGVDEAYHKATGLVRNDAWQMVINGFSPNVWYVAVFYIIAMGMLCSHLSHGVQSIFQTLGLRTRKSAGFIDCVSKGYSALIFFGFISIPVAILVFGFGR